MRRTRGECTRKKGHLESKKYVLIASRSPNQSPLQTLLRAAQSLRQTPILSSQSRTNLSARPCRHLPLESTCRCRQSKRLFETLNHRAVRVFSAGLVWQPFLWQRPSIHLPGRAKVGLGSHVQWRGGAKDEEGRTVVNSDPANWPLILNWLSFGTVPSDPSDSLLSECNYWQLEKLLAAINAKKQQQ